jgi:predicted phage terminase large subunit-like protein
MRATLNPDPDHWARQFIDWWIDEDGFAIPERSGVIRWFVLVSDDVIWSSDKEELAKKYPNSTPKSFTFIKSSLEDNQILMKADPGYLASLQAMPRVERARLLDGNWNIRPSAGMYFRRSDFDVVDTPPHCVKWVRAWDQAGTKKTSKNPNPDWTAGAKMGRTPGGQYVVAHMERFQENPSAVDKRIKNTASVDGKETMIRLAQDPGQAGKSQARSQTSMLSGYNVKAKPVTGDKETRAKPFSAQCEAGNVMVVRGPWNEDFFRELENFPEGENDDQVDAVADAFDELVVTSEPRIRTL